MHVYSVIVLCVIYMYIVAQTARSIQPCSCYQASMQYAYIAVFSKPWSLVANENMVVDAECWLYMYQGTFSLAEFAEKVKPLAAGEPIKFSPGSLTDDLIWKGMVPRCMLTCLGSHAYMRTYHRTYNKCVFCKFYHMCTCKHATRQASSRPWALPPPWTLGIVALDARHYYMCKYH